MSFKAHGFPIHQFSSVLQFPKWTQTYHNWQMSVLGRHYAPYFCSRPKRITLTIKHGKSTFSIQTHFGWRMGFWDLYTKTDYTKKASSVMNRNFVVLMNILLIISYNEFTIINSLGWMLSTIPVCTDICIHARKTCNQMLISCFHFAHGVNHSTTPAWTYLDVIAVMW